MERVTLLSLFLVVTTFVFFFFLNNTTFVLLFEFWTQAFIQMLCFENVFFFETY